MPDPPHPEALDETVRTMAEIIRRHISLDLAHFRASTEDAAWALIQYAATGNDSTPTHIGDTP